jgi:hypothetical protein
MPPNQQLLEHQFVHCPPHVIRATFHRAANSRSAGNAAPSGNESINRTSKTRTSAAFPGKTHALVLPNTRPISLGTPLQQ